MIPTSMVTNREAAQEIPEQRLWMAVIAQTVQEWISGPLRSSREAKAYLFEDQNDFPVVCHAAGLNPDRFRSELRRFKKPELCRAA